MSVTASDDTTSGSGAAAVSIQLQSGQAVLASHNVACALMQGSPPDAVDNACARQGDVQLACSPNAGLDDDRVEALQRLDAIEEQHLVCMAGPLSQKTKSCWPACISDMQAGT